MRHVPRQQKRFYLRINFKRLRPVRPVQEVRIVTNTPVGVLRAIVILPSRLQVAVVHRSLRQTSTGVHSSEDLDATCRKAGVGSTYRYLNHAGAFSRSARQTESA